MNYFSALIHTFNRVSFLPLLVKKSMYKYIAIITQAMAQTFLNYYKSLLIKAQKGQSMSSRIVFVYQKEKKIHNIP